MYCNHIAIWHLLHATSESQRPVDSVHLGTSHHHHWELTRSISSTSTVEQILLPASGLQQKEAKLAAGSGGRYRSHGRTGRDEAKETPEFLPEVDQRAHEFRHGGVYHPRRGFMPGHHSLWGLAQLDKRLGTRKEELWLFWFLPLGLL